MDIHWRPQMLLCHPCRFNYSFIIRFENLAGESNRLLDYVQTHNMKAPISQKISFPNKNKSQAKNSITRQTMQQVPEKLVGKLRQLYADDFILFNYDPFLYSGNFQ